MVSVVGDIIIVLVIILVVAAVGWIIFVQLRARRLGVRISLFNLPSLCGQGNLFHS
jgi:hypothetical protein